MKKECHSEFSFEIAKTSFPIKQIDSAEVDMLTDDVTDWPMLYILANRKDKYAYVGETTSASTRLNQHSSNEEKLKHNFNEAYIIDSESFNKSVIRDYEHRLIGLMHADQKFTLINKNEGFTSNNYYQKDKYQEIFPDLWNILCKNDLAQNAIEVLQSSEIYRYSPFKELNSDQQDASNEIFLRVKAALNNNASKPIVVSGRPGTGKTVLATFLLKRLKDEYPNLNIRIIEPMSSLRTTIETAVKTVDGLNKKDVLGVCDLRKKEYQTGYDKEKPFDILLIDEAHRLKQRKAIAQYGPFDRLMRFCFEDTTGKTELDAILSLARVPIFFYDADQAINPSCISSEIIARNNEIKEAFDHPLELKKQMRIPHGDKYLRYIHDILFEKHPDKINFSDYEFKLYLDFKEFDQSFRDKLKSHELTRMAAGYAWEWVSKKDKTHSDICIDGISKYWNSTEVNWVGKGFKDDHAAFEEVGCVHTLQGYDLEYAYIIIGKEFIYDKENNQIKADKSNYFDRKGKEKSTQEELLEYLKHIYYVLLTRGMYGTHVYVCDENLREYLAQYIDVV